MISWVCAGGRRNGAPASLWHTPVDEQDILLLTYKEAALTGGFGYTIRGSILACGEATLPGGFGTPSGARTLDTLIKSQVLYQLS